MYREPLVLEAAPEQQPVLLLARPLEETIPVGILSEQLVVQWLGVLLVPQSRQMPQSKKAWSMLSKQKTEI